ncbi:MAG: hypothetical protein JW725_03095 [Candidatus Babeliaceae bacterium]|nr:hypothetical protein [Candidatus Babeliaceae bacterium]
MKTMEKLRKVSAPISFSGGEGIRTGINVAIKRKAQKRFLTPFFIP